MTVRLSKTVQWKSSQTAEPPLCPPGSSAGAHRDPSSIRKALRWAPGGRHEGRDPSLQRRKR